MAAAHGGPRPTRRTATVLGAAAVAGLFAPAGRAQALPRLPRAARVRRPGTPVTALAVELPRWSGAPTTLSGALPPSTGAVEAAVIAVRDAGGDDRGGFLDIAHTGPCSVPSGGLPLTGRAVLAPGRYTAWVSHLAGGRWVDQEHCTFDVPAALPTPPHDPARRSGAYLGWPQTPADLTAWGRRRGRPVEVAGEYLDHRRWEWIAQPTSVLSAYGDGAWTAPLVLSVPLLADPTPQDPAPSLAAVADGRYDAPFRTLARSLAAHGLGATTLRLGWEANSPENYSWSAVPDPAAYRAAFRRVVEVVRREAPAARFDWGLTVAVDGAFDFRRCYPGDDVVDVVGIDVYDMSPQGLATDARWDWYQCAAGGLDDVAQFAVAHGKPLGVDEWAVASSTWGGGGDDPRFVDRFRTWMDRWPVAHEIYNEVEYPYSDGRLLLGDRNPRAAAEYVAGLTAGA